MAKNNAVVGVYHAHTEAEAAVKALQRSEFGIVSPPPHDLRTIATFCARMSQTARATGVIFLVNEKTRSGL
jgi:hypothetical protein